VAAGFPTHGFGREGLAVKKETLTRLQK